MNVYDAQIKAYIEEVNHHKVAENEYKNMME